MAKTAFVTGGTGFIGINLIQLLVDLDYRFQPMAVAVQDNYDWLVKEGLLAKFG